MHIAAQQPEKNNLTDAAGSAGPARPAGRGGIAGTRLSLARVLKSPLFGLKDDPRWRWPVCNGSRTAAGRHRWWDLQKKSWIRSIGKGWAPF